jgi:hypothetical protein
MTYDELEEQYYILLQRNKELEQKNNSLELQVIELETQAVVSENMISSAEDRAKTFSGMYASETLKVTQLNIVLDDTKNKLEDWKEKARNAEYDIVCLKENIIDSSLEHPYDTQEKMYPGHEPRFSVHRPMEQCEPINRTNIVLSAVDTMGFSRHIDPNTYQDAFHVYADLGGKIVRYSGSTLLHLDKYDFASSVTQMTDALKYSIAKEYFDKYHGYTFKDNF